MREMYEEAVKAYLGNDFSGEASLPHSFTLAVDKLMQADNISYNPASWSSDVIRLLRPLRKITFE